MNDLEQANNYIKELESEIESLKEEIKDYKYACENAYDSLRKVV